MIVRFAFCDDAIVASGTTSRDAGVAELRSRESRRAAMTYFAGLSRRHVSVVLTGRRCAVVAGRTSRRDAGVVERGARERRR